MQETAGQGGASGDSGRGAVEAVAGHGMADARQMDADLMGAAGGNPHLKQGEVLEALEDAIV